MTEGKAVHGGNVREYARKLGVDPGEFLDYSSNINPVPWPEGIKDYLLENIEEIRCYPDRDYHDLKKAISAYTGCPAAQIMVGNGATELIYLAVRTLKPKKALLPVPSFADYERALRGSNAEVEYYQLKEDMGFALDTERFLQALRNGCDMTVLCNPNNPTGYLIPKDELLKILEEAKKNDVVVLLDETFVEFTDNPLAATVVGELARFDNLILLRAFTKYFSLAGLRLGYCLAGSRILKRMEIRQEPWTVNVLASLLGPYLLQDEGFKARSREWITSEREFMYKGLAQLDGLRVYESQASFFLLKLLKKDWNAKMLAERLLKEYIMIRKAEGFVSLDDTFFRLAVKDRESNSKVLRAIENGLC